MEHYLSLKLFFYLIFKTLVVIHLYYVTDTFNYELEYVQSRMLSRKECFLEIFEVWCHTQKACNCKGIEICHVGFH